jgi:hypothetical protein
MANDKDIKIGIQTQADTAGIDKAVVSLTGLDAAATQTANTSEKMTKSIFGVAPALASEQQAQDLVIAKRRQADRAAKAAAGNMQNFGMVVNQVGYQVTDFAIQTQMGTSAITAFAQQAPQAIGAITSLGKGFKFSWSAAIGAGTAIGVFATAAAVGLQMAAREWDAMRAAQDKAKKSAEDYQEALKFMRQQQALLAQQVRLDFVTQNYKEQTEYLERQVELLKQVNEIRAAQGDTAAAQANLAVTQARNAGGDVFGAQANALAVGVENQVDQLQSKLSESKAALAEAVQGFDTANAVLAELRRRDDMYGDAYKEADEKYNAALDAKAAAEQRLATDRKLYEEGLAALQANTAAELSTLTTGAIAAVTESAKTTLAAIQQQAADSGGNLSSSARESMVGLEKILADGIVKLEEMTRLREAMDRIRVSREGADKEIMAGLESLYKTTNSVLSTLPDLRNRIAALESKAAQ